MSTHSHYSQLVETMKECKRKRLSWSWSWSWDNWSWC